MRGEMALGFGLDYVLAQGDAAEREAAIGGALFFADHLIAQVAQDDRGAVNGLD